MHVCRRVRQRKASWVLFLCESASFGFRQTHVKAIRFSSCTVFRVETGQLGLETGQFGFILTLHVVQQSEAKEWQSDAKLFRLWAHGLTGYPLIDANMRELRGPAGKHPTCRCSGAWRSWRPSVLCLGAYEVPLDSCRIAGGKMLLPSWRST